MFSVLCWKASFSSSKQILSGRWRVKHRFLIRSYDDTCTLCNTIAFARNYQFHQIYGRFEVNIIAEFQVFVRWLLITRVHLCMCVFVGFDSRYEQQQQQKPYEMPHCSSMCAHVLHIHSLMRCTTIELYRACIDISSLVASRLERRWMRYILQPAFVRINDSNYHFARWLLLNAMWDAKHDFSLICYSLLLDDIDEIQRVLSAD